MIRVYREGDLSSGFVGVRVAVSVNNKLKQKYYPISSYNWDKAQELASEYEKELKAKQLQYFKNNVFSKETNTKIKGLYITVDKTKRKNRFYAYPCLSYMFLYKNELKSKKFYIPNNIITDETWFEVCLFIKNSRNLLNKTFQRLLSMKPKQSTIDNVIKHDSNS